MDEGINERFYQFLLTINPDLTADGFGVKEGHDFETERARLHTMYEDFEKAYYYIWYIPDSWKKKIFWNKTSDSQYLAGFASKILKMKICEGAFIAAALAHQFEVKLSKFSTSCTFKKPEFAG